MFLRWLFLSYIFFKWIVQILLIFFFPFQPLGIIIDILNYYFEERFLVPMMTSKKIFCRHHTHHLHTICVTLAILLCFDVYFPINSNDYFWNNLFVVFYYYQYFAVVVISREDFHNNHSIFNCMISRNKSRWPLMALDSVGFSACIIHDKDF